MNSIPKNSGIVSVKLFDRMIDRQTRALSRTLQQSIAAAGGRIRLLLTIETQLQGRSPESLFAGLHFVRLHADHIERLAIVGSKAGESTIVGLFGLFGGLEVRYFDRSQVAEAVGWLQGFAGRKP